MDYSTLDPDQFATIDADDFALLPLDYVSSSSSGSSLSSVSSDSSSHSSQSSQSAASSSSSSSHRHSEATSSSSGLLVSARTISADIYLAIAQFYADAYERQVGLTSNFESAVEQLRCLDEVEMTVDLLQSFYTAAQLAKSQYEDVSVSLTAVRTLQRHVATTTRLAVADWIAEAVEGGKVPYAWALLSKMVGFNIDSVIDWTTESSSSSSS